MGSAKIVIAPPNDMPVGTYTVRIKAGATEESPAFRHFLELGHPSGKELGRGQLNGFPLKALHVTGTPANPELIETQGSGEQGYGTAIRDKRTATCLGGIEEVLLLSCDESKRLWP